MPVYVSRAHVTIGDPGKRHTNRAYTRRAFHFSDICKTPYCCRTFFVVFFGLAVLAGGVILTIIGYKPSILIPWYNTKNVTLPSNNYTDPTSVPRILGEPGPLRILVYIGPILMGIGFFSMMMAIVLFCEIKDRYFNNILPHRRRFKKCGKDKMYDLIISEFRKNYFRGIEVPLERHTEPKKKPRFSLSLSGSGSLASLGRRLSHDFQRRRRRSSRESQPDRATVSTRKKSTLKRIIDPDSWLKTSSLPNIRQKDSLVELHNIYNIDNKIGIATAREYKSCGPHLDIFRISGDTSGVDNPAYRDSPSDKRKRPPLRKQRHISTSNINTCVTTVLVHRESDNEETSGKLKAHTAHIPSPTPIKRQHKDSIQDESMLLGDTHDSILDTGDTNDSDLLIHTRETDLTDIRIDQMCMCGHDILCEIHNLGMDSGSSNLSLSWDNVPCVYNDARRNTEPFLLYAAVPQRVDDNDSNSKSQTNVLVTQRSASNVGLREIIKSKPKAFLSHSGCSDDFKKKEKKFSGPFKATIGMFRSDSRLFRSRNYSEYDDSEMLHGGSTESLDLTEDVMKNFEMAETAYI